MGDIMHGSRSTCLCRPSKALSAWLCCFRIICCRLEQADLGLQKGVPYAAFLCRAMSMQSGPRWPS